MLLSIVTFILFCIAMVMFIHAIRMAPTTCLSDIALASAGLPATREIEQMILTRESEFAYIEKLKQRYALRRAKANTHNVESMSPMVAA